MTYTIVVGVDGQPEHRAALNWAAERAARDGARLEIVYVIERTWGDQPETPDRLLVLAAKTLLAAERGIAESRAARRAVQTATRVPAAANASSSPASAAGTASAGRPAAPPLAIGARYLYGHVGNELAFVSREADLLVVGARSGSGADGSFTGSLAVRVAATAACAVAVVPHDWDGSGEGVVVGVDGRPPSEVALAFAADEAAALGEPLTVACAGFEANPLLAGFVPEISLGDRREHVVGEAARTAREAHPGLEVGTRVVEASPSRGVLAAAGGARMLVVGTRNRHGVKRVMLGSVSHDILLNVRIPVVVARNRVETPAFEEHTR